jgi:molybdopterin/thiamine biosynthesis adenylyltransferase
MYPIVSSLADPNNRQTNYTVNLLNGTLTVIQAVPEIIWTNPAPIIYGASLASNQLNAVANVPGAFAYTPTNGTVLNSGTNALGVLFTPTDTLDYSNVTQTVSLVVSPAPLTVTAANTNRAYGQANPTFGGTITGVTNGDNITATYSCSATSGSPVGMYLIVSSLADPNNRQTNYTVSLVDGTLTVVQAVPAIIWTNPSPIIYGAPLASNQLNAVANVSGAFAYTPTNGTVLNTGTNTLGVLFTPTDTLDYSNAAAVVSLIVSPAPLTVTAANTNRAYGQANPTFGGTITGVTNGDNITATYSCSATSGSPVGTYPIVPILIDPNDRQTNYTVSLVDGTLTVDQAVPAIIWTNPSPIIYGASLTSNQLNAVANVPGAFAYTPTNGTVLNSGTNALGVLFTSTDTLDYSNVTQTVSLVVSPAPMTVTAANTNRAYGQANPTFGGTITGVTNGDNITATYSCSATSGSPVGTYPIVPILIDPNDRQTNYTVNLLNGTLTVIQAVPEIIWTNPAPIIYGASVASNQLNAVANVPGAFAYTPTNGTVLNSGTNALGVLFTSTDTLDYSNVTQTVSLVVSPAPLTVTAANTNRAYGQANPTFGGTITGVTNGDNITATYSCSATSGSPVGTYPIVPILIDPNDRQTNYTVSLVDGTLTVDQAVPAIIWTNPSPIIYGASLTSNQLNAVANVPGAFAYTPTNGTVLNAGTNTMDVLFTPADTTDYRNAAAMVSLIVSQASLGIGSGITANNKVYDGTTTATLNFNDVVLAGVVNGDTVSLDTNGCLANFASPTIGHDIAVTVTGLTLTGAAAGNYTLVQPGNLVADITAPSLQIVASLPDIVISWTTNATVYTLNQTASLAPPLAWSRVTNSIAIIGTNNTVVMNAASVFRYFELIAAP